MRPKAPRVELSYYGSPKGKAVVETIHWPWPGFLPVVGDGVYHPKTGVALGRVSGVSWHLKRKVVEIRIGP